MFGRRFGRRVASYRFRVETSARYRCLLPSPSGCHLTDDAFECAKHGLDRLATVDPFEHATLFVILSQRLGLLGINPHATPYGRLIIVGPLIQRALTAVAD